MTFIEVYAFALPFLIMTFALGIYWWTGRHTDNDRRNRAR
jgi:hypothetical protein